MLEREQADTGQGKIMDETISEAREEMEVRNTPDQGAVEKDITTQELLQDLSGDDSPPLGSLPKDLELPSMSETFNMGILLLSAEESKKKFFEGNGCEKRVFRWMRFQ